MNRIVDQKKKDRKKILAQRNSLAPSKKQNYDTWVCEQLEALIVSNNYQVIHAYLPIGSEIDIFPLLEKLLALGLTVITPKTLKDRKLQQLVLEDVTLVEQGLYGTYFPSNANEYLGNYDIIIVPAVAFDTDRFRLGYGGGYYDTFLANHQQAMKVGICYPFQHITSVPREAHDISVDKVIVKEKIG